MLLPYQTSLNAMQKRLIERLNPEAATKPENWNQTVSLIHGRATRHIYEAFLKHDHAPSEAAEGAKLQGDVGRLLVAPVAVSTVFSVIRLLFATRGAERLFVGFAGARIIVDEIHAYTPEITALTLATLRFLQKQLGSRILFMSATVPLHLREALVELMDIKPIPKAPLRSAKVRHRLQTLPFHSQSAAAARMIEAAAQQGSVLVVVNQVKRAINLWQQLKDTFPCEILHSRFHLADRARIESNFGPEPACILIATQAVEVSLDLNFRTCFSELAPFESLVQRFGRCNRRGKEPDPANVFVFAAFPDEHKPWLPYLEEHVQRVGEILADFCKNGPRELDDDAQVSLLSASYPADLQAALKQQIADKTERVARLFLQDWKPFGVGTPDELQRLEEQWAALFDGAEVLPEACVAQARAQASWFGVTRYLVPISGQQFRRFSKEIHWSEELSCYVIRRDYTEAGLQLHSDDD
jgi:CRISPR-associated endonuclease/helicase Cas3